MNHIVKIKPLSVNKCFKGTRYRTVEYDKFIRDMFILLPKSIEIPNK